MALAIPLWAAIVIPTGFMVFLVFASIIYGLRHSKGRRSSQDDGTDEESPTIARYKLRRGRMVPASWNVSLTGSMFGLHQFHTLEEDNLTGGPKLARSRSPFSFFSDRPRKNRSTLSFTPSEKTRNLDDIGRHTPTRENNREFLENVDQAFLSKVPTAKVVPVSRSKTSGLANSGSRRKARPSPIPHRSSSQRDRTMDAQRHPPDTGLRALSPILASPRDSPHTLPNSSLSGSTTVAGHSSPETVLSKGSATNVPSPLNPQSAWLRSSSQVSGTRVPASQVSGRSTSPETGRQSSKSTTITTYKSLEKPKSSRPDVPSPLSRSASSTSAARAAPMSRPNKENPSTTPRSIHTATSLDATRPKSTFETLSRPQTSSSAGISELTASPSARPKSSYQPRQKNSSILGSMSIAPPAPPPKPTIPTNDRPISSFTTKSRTLTTASFASLSSDFTIASAYPTPIFHVQPSLNQAAAAPPMPTSSFARPRSPSPSPLPTTSVPLAPASREDNAPGSKGGESRWKPPSAWENVKSDADKTVHRKSSLGLGANVEVGVTKKGSVLRKKSLRGQPPPRTT